MSNSTVTVRNHGIHVGTIRIVRRFLASGAETQLAELPEGEFLTTILWDGCEIVIRTAASPSD